MKKLLLNKQPQTSDVFMTVENLKICAQNQEGYETLYLNDSLQLQYCNFVNIANLQQCITTELTPQQQQNTTAQHPNYTIKGVNTLFLNNNLISKIQNLHPLAETLVTLNLSYNRIATLEGVKTLVNLVVLDVSYNFLRDLQAEEIKSLKKLNRLSLAANLFYTAESIEAIVELKDNLQTFDLSSNQTFNSEPQILSQILSKMCRLKVLIMKQTPFVRMTSAYRKRVILSAQSLVFLDDRPVTEDERLLAKAWQKGGLKEENEARKLIRQKSQQKNKKIYQDIEQRQQLIDQKVEKVFQLKARKYIEQLQSLKSFTSTQDFQLLGSEQQSLVRLKIQQLERYLQLFKQQCRSMDLDKELGINIGSLPKMLVEKRTPECIFVYNVEESQLEAIRQKYYPDEELPLKAVNYAKPTQQLYWLEEYNVILQRTFKLCKGNWEMIVPAFNLDVHEYDQSTGRNVRRFEEQQIRKKIKQIMKNDQGGRQDQQGHYVNVSSVTRGMNELDCLD